MMVVARLPAGAGVHMEKSHCREYCPSVGLSQVILRAGYIGDEGGGACKLDRHTAHTQPIVLPCSAGTECKHTCSVVLLLHCHAGCML